MKVKQHGPEGGNQTCAVFGGTNNHPPWAFRTGDMIGLAGWKLARSGQETRSNTANPPLLGVKSFSWMAA